MTIKRDEGYVEWHETMIARGYSGIKIKKRKTFNPEDFIPLIEINVTISIEALHDLRAAGEPDDVVQTYIVNKFKEEITPVVKD
jgi:hypothetical protein